MNDGEEKIIYKDLSFKVNGILFEVHNQLGRDCNEKQVGDAIENGLKGKAIGFKRESVLPESFVGEKSGRNRTDILIENKIVLEIKCKRFLTKDDYYQVKRYLKAANLKLGILVNFRDERLKLRRILN